MCREKQEAEPGFPEIKPDECPMLIMLSQRAATAFLELDFDGDEEVEVNGQQCYEMMMDMYNADMNWQAVGILKTVFTHFGCEKTYCCNPFVTAAYKQGAGAKEVDCKVRGKRFGLANDNNRVLKNTKAFKRISKPKKITSLEPGDILLSPTHAMLYAGGGKAVEAVPTTITEREIPAGTIPSVIKR